MMGKSASCTLWRQLPSALPGVDFKPSTTAGSIVLKSMSLSCMKPSTPYCMPKTLSIFESAYF